MYIPTYFKSNELFDQESLDSFKKNDLTIWGLMDENLLMLLDNLRRSFGPMYINTNGMTYRGFRSPSCTVGSKYSQHRFGRAADINFKNHNHEAVIRYILSHPEDYPQIMAIELGVEWLHLDVRNCSRILTFRR